MRRNTGVPYCALRGLKFQFEAVSHLPPEEQQVVKEVLESLIIKYQVRRWDSSRQATAK
jgi:hypothetical protein